jgi:hypothetical protein
MIALRVRPNSSTDFIKGPPVIVELALRGLTVGSQQELVAEKHRAIGDDQFAGLQTSQDLAPASLSLDPNLYDSLHKTAAIGGHPHGHRSSCAENCLSRSRPPPLRTPYKPLCRLAPARRSMLAYTNLTEHFVGPADTCVVS